jgi:hypothetical protein
VILRITASVAAATLGAWAAEAAPSKGEEAAFAAFEHALDECEIRAKSLDEARFSFLRSSEDLEGTKLLAKFTPQGESGGWELVDPDTDQPKKKTRRAYNDFSKETDSDRIIHLREPRSYMHGTYALTGETADSWVFTGPAVDVKDQSEKAQNFMKKARHALVTEIVVGKSPARLRSVTMTNVKPIHPLPIAVIEDFELQYVFGEAWPGGPIVVTAARQYVKGNALFAKIRQDLRVENSAMTLLKE